MKQFAIAFLVMLAAMLTTQFAKQPAEAKTLEVRYGVFGMDYQVPMTSGRLKVSSHNITSCVAGKEDELTAILDKASEPAKYDDIYCRLFVKVGDSEYLVDQRGVVRHDGKDNRLSDKDFYELSLFLFINLPFNSTESLTNSRGFDQGTG